MEKVAKLEDSLLRLLGKHGAVSYALNLLLMARISFK